MIMIVEGETYESKTGVRFKVKSIDPIKGRASIIFLDSGSESIMDLDDIEKSLNQNAGADR
jgi:hypothetical protein